MRKRICHFLCFFVLLIVSYNHYQFSSKDTRNLLDTHDGLYAAPAIGYANNLYQGVDDYKAPLYGKIIGCFLFVFGKSYFVLRMTYLLFFLLYLGAFYLLVIRMTGSALSALLALLIHTSVPFVISYSRMCWPHMYSAAFILVSLIFLLRFFQNEKGRYLNSFLSLLFGVLSIKMYCTSLVFIVLILSWIILFNYKFLLNRKLLSLIVFLMLPNVFFFFVEDFMVVADKGFADRSVAAIDFYRYKFLFLNEMHLFVFAFVLIVAVLYIYIGSYKIFQKYIFREHKLFLTSVRPYKNNMILFLLFLAFTFPAEAMGLPINVTVLGFSGACMFIAFFIVNVRYLSFRFFMVSLCILSFICLSFFPERFMSYGEIRNKHLHQTAVIPDQMDWGIKELKEWMTDVYNKDERVLLFSQPFYPGIGTKHIQIVDLDLMLSDFPAQGLTIEPKFIKEYYRINFLKDLNVELISDVKINEYKFKQTLRDDNIDYLIFEEIKEMQQWLFLEDDNKLYYDFFKVLVDNLSQDNLDFNYNQLFANFLKEAKTNDSAYLFQYQYLKGYYSLGKFISGDTLFEEVKRIKCSVKDIVIYRITK